MTQETETVPLRLLLRHETAASHAALDATTDAGDLTDPVGYARFLTRQYRARVPIEAWVERACPEQVAPPPVAHLIAADLAATGCAIPHIREHFELPAGADPIGMAWAIAGSHLGNRMMLKTLQENEADLPCSFLSDQSMQQFWRGLRPHLDRPVSEVHGRPAITAASSVFAHFLTIFADQAESKAAA